MCCICDLYSQPSVTAQLGEFLLGNQEVPGSKPTLTAEWIDGYICRLIILLLSANNIFASLKYMVVNAFDCERMNDVAKHN
jgi:hypothetical protein